MVEKKKPKVTVGLIEEVTIIGRKELKTLALFDTGAKVSSVDISLASKAKLGPIVRTQRIKNPSFKQQTMRPVVSAKIRIKKRIFESMVNIQDRSHMTFPIIIGRNIIVGNFIVDPQKNLNLFDKMKDIKENNILKGQRKLRHFMNNDNR